MIERNVYVRFITIQMWELYNGKIEVVCFVMVSGRIDTDI